MLLDCVVSLGMASGNIKDRQITASSTLSDEWLPKFARLNGNKAWCGKPNDKSDKDEYLQIDLGKVNVLYTQAVMYYINCCQNSVYWPSFALL